MTLTPTIEEIIRERNERFARLQKLTNRPTPTQALITMFPDCVFEEEPQNSDSVTMHDAGIGWFV
jgi:hypothetical protein